MITALQSNGFTSIVRNQTIASASSPAIMFSAYDKNAYGPGVGADVLLFALPLGYEYKGWFISSPTVYSYTNLQNSVLLGSISFESIKGTSVFGGSSSGDGPWITWKELVPLEQQATSTSTSSSTVPTTTISSSSSTTVSTSSTTTSTSTTTIGSGGWPYAGYQAMINLITWTSANGYGSIQWSNITELDIFHMDIGPTGLLLYDGGLSNLASIISTAHQHNVKVALAIGGAGMSPAIINSTLASGALRSTVINNIISQVQIQGYDGVQIDFEGKFNSSQFTAFMHQLSSSLWSINPSYTIDVSFADWEISSFNIPALAPYANHFDLMFDPSTTDLTHYSSELGGNQKLSAGYDLSNPTDIPGLAQNIEAAKGAGYGVFFWQAALMNNSVYSAIGK
jgi:hypothetical protein